MAESNQKSHNDDEFIPFFENCLKDDDDEFHKQIFLNNDNYFSNYNLLEKEMSPKIGEQAPSPLFPALEATIDEDFSEFFYILNPISGVLEEAPKNVAADIQAIIDNDDDDHHHHHQCISTNNSNENTDVVPAKKLKRELTVYEETLLKNFSVEIEKEQKLLAAEHEKKMQLWELEMQTNQQQHALKMAILKEQLEKIQQEKKQLEMPKNLKYLSKFKSGPI